MQTWQRKMRAIVLALVLAFAALAGPWTLSTTAAADSALEQLKDCAKKGGTC
jgi:hypothetical protein